LENLISIVVLTKNSARTLNSCLDSIDYQTYRNIELVVVDSKSEDATVNIAEKHSAKVIQTEQKLLGARYLGFISSKGSHILYLDSDQILYPNTLERAIDIIQDYDMLCFEEESHKPQTILEKLINADRKLINDHALAQLEPLTGVLIPRFYRSDLLRFAFQKIPLDNLRDIIFFDDSIIYYEARLISSRVGILRKAILHLEVSSIPVFCYKSYLYGKNTKQLRKTGLYLKLLKKKARPRKGIALDLRSIESIILFLLRNIPFFVGVGIGRLGKSSRHTST
jgi:glycosyltransferase involved in cell wall biosynthesis